MWRERLFCDIEVIVEGRKFSTHRFILASHSDYMKTLFLGNRFSDSNRKSIELKDMSSDAFESVLAWMYTGQCEVDNAYLTGILEAVIFLQCTSFLPEIVEVTSKSLISSTCLSAWETGEKFNIPSLVEAAERKALSCFAEVVSMSEFTSLPLKRLVVLISSDELSVVKEEDVFDSVVRWAEAQDCPPTDAELGRVFSYVRFPLMSDDFVKEKVETEKLLLSTPQGMLSLSRSFREAYRSGVVPRAEANLKWEDIEVGMKVWIINDRQSLKNLCEQVVPGASKALGWNPD
ncbi:unnamed protein product, partial [Heterosigma akashiwo]